MRIRFAPLMQIKVRFLITLGVTALPPDVRRRLCLAGKVSLSDGLCPGFGLGPSGDEGQRPNQRQSRRLMLHVSGEA